MVKDLQGAGLVPNLSGTQGIATADKETHARMRRLLAPAFSEKALREQEGFLRGYVDKLVDGLRDCAAEGPQDMVKWFNWTTFDGECVECVSSRVVASKHGSRVKAYNAS